MKRLGPLNGSGSRSETSFRAVEQGSDTRSDAWRASPPSGSLPSLPKPTASTTLLTGTGLTVVLTARGRSRFDVSFNENKILKASTQPICNAARVLHRLGYSDDLRLIVCHQGSDHPCNQRSTRLLAKTPRSGRPWAAVRHLGAAAAPGGRQKRR
jgi:hypothetical protein